MENEAGDQPIKWQAPPKISILIFARGYISLVLLPPGSGSTIADKRMPNVQSANSHGHLLMSPRNYERLCLPIIRGACGILTASTLA
jgi:hypothetical protein